ncbi:hypothetical protein M427DRAFT_54418 [Gonapodya prolifera JEL478]|uniref:Ankyrin n=1 Tax=Gonapodya prolifera (strain JEL478) TaxID=1344416 RepID=A0A139AMP3_GONPJ|nr:hypothetical protein M427DRAFT_54418 [Gonapodya prolifera JEL478]|eukprot:KXS17844.1 hypothetical protein M427DRAFT_54418 [Gonapodya prolifera JEL478]
MSAPAVAALHGHLDALKLLISRGLKLGSNTDKALRDIAAQGNLPIVKAVIEASREEYRRYSGLIVDSALRSACVHDYTDMSSNYP